MNLKHLTDRILLEDTKQLASTEKALTVKILHHLKEIERRKLFSDLGYSSLYDYCIRELGYAEASAHRRIASARLLGELPSIEGHIKKGALNLTTLSNLVQFFKEEDVKDSSLKEKIVKEVQGLSRRECDLKLMQLSERPHVKKEAVWLTEEVILKLKEYRDLKGTYESWADIISEALDMAIAEIQRSKFKLVKAPRKLRESESRMPSASVKREVFLRDQKCIKCGSMRSLQFDHTKPFSLGGKSTTGNIRLLCFNCNQRERIGQRL